MKKLVCIFLACLTVLLSGCGMFSRASNNIGKSDNTVKSVYSALNDNLAERGMEDYVLYGVKMLVNSENVGTYTYVYTDKRPDNMQYSDILIVEVNNRSGKIEKCSAPDYAQYGTEPYELISSAMPLDPVKLEVDSDTAIKNAALSHAGDSFIYNYIELVLSYKNGMFLYDIGHVSLVNDCVYRSTVDAGTGDVIEATVEEL